MLGQWDKIKPLGCSLTWFHACQPDCEDPQHREASPTENTSLTPLTSLLCSAVLSVENGNSKSDSPKEGEALSSAHPDPLQHTWAKQLLIDDDWPGMAQGN